MINFELLLYGKTIGYLEGNTTKIECEFCFLVEIFKESITSKEKKEFKTYPDFSGFPELTIASIVKQINNYQS